MLCLTTFAYIATVSDVDQMCDNMHIARKGHGGNCPTSCLLPPQKYLTKFTIR